MIKVHNQTLIERMLKQLEALSLKLYNYLW